jgi:hypothetical protein
MMSPLLDGCVIKSVTHDVLFADGSCGLAAAKATLPSDSQMTRFLIECLPEDIYGNDIDWVEKETPVPPNLPRANISRNPNRYTLHSAAIRIRRNFIEIASKYFRFWVKCARRAARAPLGSKCPTWAAAAQIVFSFSHQTQLPQSVCFPC